MGIEGIGELKPEDEKALEELRRKLGTTPPRAYIIDRTISHCQLLVGKLPYQTAREYDVILRKASEGLSDVTFYNGDVVVIGDPMGSEDIEIGVIRAVALQGKQLRLIGPRIYEVKPVQP